MKGMTHDLNTIFNAMIHFEVIEKKIKEIESKIPAQIHDALRDDFILIDKTITYLRSNIATGVEILKNSLAIQEVGQSMKSVNSIDDIAHSVVNTLRRNLAKSNISINLYVQKNMPPVICNKSDIYRLVVNIVINSIYATNKIENPEINIRLWYNENIVKISISDNGSGIPDKALPHIFEERFTMREKGKGLGLSLVKRIVDGLGGEISVFSNAGEGTTFTISIPGAQQSD